MRLRASIFLPRTKCYCRMMNSASGSRCNIFSVRFLSSFCQPSLICTTGTLFVSTPLIPIADVFGYSGSLDGTPIYGWKGDFNNNQPHQCWFFKSMSLSNAQVNTVIKNNPHLSTQYKGYQTDGECVFFLSHRENYLNCFPVPDI